MNDLKRAAAAEALGRVRSGMKLGLGTGSTARAFVDLLGAATRSGALDGLRAVATSRETEAQARALGLELAPLHQLAPLDLTVDGADEVDPGLDLIKGLGGALLREKMVARHSRALVVIADASKRVDRLGTRAPLPVEVVPFAWEVHLPFLSSLGCRPTLRAGGDGRPYTTDNGNYVIDCAFPDGIDDPAGIDLALQRTVGVIETGLFLGLATEAVLAAPEGVSVCRAERAAEPAH